MTLYMERTIGLDDHNECNRHASNAIRDSAALKFRMDFERSQ